MLKVLFFNLRYCAISIAFAVVASSLFLVHGDLQLLPVKELQEAGSGSSSLSSGSHRSSLTNRVEAPYVRSDNDVGGPSREIQRLQRQRRERRNQRYLQTISIVPIDDEDEENYFYRPQPKPSFGTECVEYLLSDSVVADQQISNIEYTTFLLNYCGGQIVGVSEEDIVETCHGTTTSIIQQKQDILNYFSLNSNLRFTFFYTACPLYTPEGSHCLTDFDMSNFGIIITPATTTSTTSTTTNNIENAAPSNTATIEERIQALCDDTYTILSEEGLLDDLYDESTGGEQPLPSPPPPVPAPTLPPSPSQVQSPPISVPTPLLPPAPSPVAITTTTPPISAPPVNFVPTITAPTIPADVTVATSTSSPTSVGGSSSNNSTYTPRSIIRAKNGRFTTAAILGIISVVWACLFFVAVLCSTGGWKAQNLSYDTNVYESNGGGGGSPTSGRGSDADDDDDSVTASPHRNKDQKDKYSKQSSSPATTAGDEYSNSSSAASPVMERRTYGHRHDDDEELGTTGGRGRR